MTGPDVDHPGGPRGTDSVAAGGPGPDGTPPESRKSRLPRSGWARVRLVLGWSVIAVAVVVVVAEVVGRTVAERVIEDQISSAGVAGDVDVTIGRSWWQPSIIGVLLFDTLDQVDVRLTAASLYSTQVSEADYVLRELALDVSIDDRSVTINSIKSGSVRVQIDPSNIAAMFGVEVSVRDGSLFVAGSSDRAQVRVAGSDLVIGGPGDTSDDGDVLRLPIADPAIFPCSPEVKLVDRFVELACTGDRLPGILSNSLGSGARTSRGEDLPPLDKAELPPPATLDLPASSTAPSTASSSTAPSTVPSSTGGG